MVEVNAEKCVFIFFNRKQSPYQVPSIKINQDVLEVVESTRYLGFILDKKLRWKLHVESRCLAASRIINGFRRYLRLTWGLSTANLKLIYKTIIIPTLLYGCSVWAGALRYKWCTRKLRSAQRGVTKHITRAFKTSSTLSLLVIANVLPAELRAIELTFSRYLCLKSNPFSVSAYALIKPLLLSLPNSDIDLANARWHNDKVPPWSSQKNDHFALSVPTQCQYYALLIYTDGSKFLDEVGAAAFFINELNTSSLTWKLPNYVTILQAELFAIFSALKFALQTTHVHSKIIIRCDSKTEVNQLVNESIKISKQAYNIRNLIVEQRLNVAFEWVKSHSSCEENNIADRLAKQAAKSTSPVDTNAIPYCLLEAKNLIKNSLWAKWDDEWKCSKTSATTREFFPSSLHATCLNKLFVPHEITQIISGHSLLNSYLAKTNSSISQNCRCGAPIEDTHHFIFTCPLFEYLRLNLKQSITQNNIEYPCPIAAFSSSQDLWNSFQNFVIKTKRLELSNRDTITIPHNTSASLIG